MPPETPPEISLVVTNTSTFIKGSLGSEYYHALKKELGYLPENALFRVRFQQQDPKKGWAKDWDGRVTTVCYSKAKCKCAVKKDGTHFPTGLVSKAIAFFKQSGVPYKIYDKREPVVKSMSLSVNTDQMEQRDYQSKVTNDALNKERGLIKMATGGGKTATAADMIAQLNVSPFIFYVTSKDLMSQAKEELSRFILQNGKNLEVGVIGDGKCDIRDVNVMTVQTAIRACGLKYKKYDDEEEITKEQEISEAKRKDIRDLITSAKGMMCDEVQHWRADTCQVISDYSVSCRYKWGFSATPWRDAGDDILIDACFGRLICDINASFLIAHPKKYLIKPDIYFVPVRNMRGRVFDTYDTAYKTAIVENPVRNQLIVKIANQMADQGRIILILCRHIAHGEMLENLIPGSVFLHGSHGGKYRKEHLESMRQRKSPITIATSIFDEGIDCRPLDTLILAGSGKSQTRALQRVGRILRPYPGKEDAIAIDFEDSCKYMLGHANKRRKIYETEPEFNIDTLNISEK